MLAWYTGHGIHLHELKLSQAYSRLEACGNRELLEQGEAYLLGRSTCLKKRLRAYLDDIDERLGDLIRSDPAKFLRGPRVALRLIADTVRKHRREFSRVWILLFDGMRFDTWEAVVWPILSEHFELLPDDTKPWFTVPPSKTDIARRSLFAGNTAVNWKNYQGKWTRDERILVARALGLNAGEADSKVRFVAEADTEKARRQMGFSDTDARDVNVLIYPISDDMGHYESDSLSSVNEKIRHEMATKQGLRGILDDLRSRIGNDDLVLITSDHGFIELSTQRSIEFKRAEAHAAKVVLEDAVAYRYLKDFKLPKGKHIGSNVTIEWEEFGPSGKQKRVFILPVGSLWYQREGGKSTTYSHGGVSMAEMVIPAALLKPITQKQSRIEILDVPEELTVEEDSPTKISIRLRNAGNVETGYELAVASNLDESLLSRSGSLAAGKTFPIECEFTPRYACGRSGQVLPDKTTHSIVLRLRHTDLQGHMADARDPRIVIRVKVKPKAVKLIADEMFAGLPE